MPGKFPGTERAGEFGADKLRADFPCGRPCGVDGRGAIPEITSIVPESHPPLPWDEDLPCVDISIDKDTKMCGFTPNHEKSNVDQQLVDSATARIGIISEFALMLCEFCEGRMLGVWLSIVQQQRRNVQFVGVSRGGARCGWKQVTPGLAGKIAGTNCEDAY